MAFTLAAIAQFPYFADPDKGRPVFFGQLFIGEVDTDPEIPGNQKTVNLRQEGTDIPAVAQPITLGAGGIAMYQGSPAQVLVDGNYSAKLLNNLGAQIWYVPDAIDDTPLTEQIADQLYLQLTGGVVDGDVTITGDLIVDAATTDPASISARNDEGGLSLVADAAGVSLQVTQADGSVPLSAVGISSVGEAILYHADVLQLLTSDTGGQLANVWIAPTAAPGTDTTQLATTAFVDVIPHVIELISNGNGLYKRWSDGYLEQWGVGRNINATSTDTWTFPTPFADASSVFVGVNRTEGSTSYSRVCTAARPTVNNVVVDNADDAAAAAYDIFAFGY